MDKLYSNVVVDEPAKSPPVKVSVIGVGAVGMAAAFSMVTQSIVNVLALVDADENKVKGEVLDLQQGTQFLDSCKVIGGKELKHTENSNVVFVAAGARQREGESRLNLVQRNLEIFKSIIPEIARLSPDCIIVIVSNPVDILTHVAWKLSGFQRNRVLGTGTILDSARFRFMLGQKLNVAASSVHGYVIGEHGDSSVPIWSKLSVGGVNLSSLNPKIGLPDDPEHFGDIHKYVVESAYEIIKYKGYTSWAIGLSCAHLCRSLVYDKNTVLPVTTNIRGMYGIDFDCFMSIPCVVGSHGVSRIIHQQLSSEEVSKLQASAATLKKVSDGLKW